VGRAADALKLVEEHIDALDAAGWKDRRIPEELRVKRLYYYRPFLMVEATLDDEDNSFARFIPREERVDTALRELPGNLAMGYIAVVSARDTLDYVLKDAVSIIDKTKCLLVGPVAYYRQIGIASLGFKPV
jgi:hypothetical protein